MSHHSRHQAVPRQGRRKNIVPGRQILTVNAQQYNPREEYEEVTAPILLPKDGPSLNAYGRILDEGNRMTGKVKWFNLNKGYGFIQTKDGGEGARGDIFVHFSGIAMSGRKKLEEGQTVEFELEGSGSNRHAVRVTIMADNTPAPSHEEDFFRTPSKGSTQRLMTH
jgi:CspA family cold shock protein